MPENNSINRIVIIGNGFGLSLGLATNYEDFLIDYIINENILKNNIAGTKSKLIEKINYISPQTLYSYEINQEHINQIKAKISIPNIKVSLEEWLNYLKSMHIHIIMSDFFSEICKAKKNWTDLETFYFNYLFKNNLLIENIDEINEEFEELSNQLVKYLKKIDTNIDYTNHKQLIRECERKVIYIDDKDDSQHNFRKKVLSDTLIPTINVNTVFYLNFNYTDTINKLLNEFGISHPNIINIHGNIIDNSIILGYGDETSEQYETLENANKFGALKYIKSSKYLLSNQYSKLNTIIDSNFYEVYVIGHSLGISDRVLLKQIFENEKCVSIKIFHHNGEESFFNSAVNITRHFKNKTEMRTKIQAYRSENSIPQIKKN